MPRYRRLACWGRCLGGIALACLLTACASDPARLTVGTPQAQVLQRLGQPTGRHVLPAGDGATQRLQYSGQPMARYVYNVDLDAQGRVLQVTQALDETRFARIEVDRWTRDEVLREFGPPAEIGGVHAFRGEVWTWRYQLGPWFRLLHIYIDPDGVVRRWHPADEPLPDWMDR